APDPVDRRKRRDRHVHSVQDRPPRGRRPRAHPTDGPVPGIPRTGRPPHRRSRGDGRHRRPPGLPVRGEITYFSFDPATYGRTIRLGSTTRSNSASVTKPSSRAACFKVRSFSIAWCAICEALSYPITGVRAVTSISERST